MVTRRGATERHSVTRGRPTQLNAPRLNPMQQTGRYPEGWKAELTLVIVCIPRCFTCLQTAKTSNSHLIATRPRVERRKFSVFYANKPPLFLYVISRTAVDS